MAWSRPKRKVPAPQQPQSHQSDNPMFQSEATPAIKHFRAGVFTITGGIFFLAFLIYGIYGPWLRITKVTISGTHKLNPTSVANVSNRILDQYWGLVIPNRNLWLVSAPYIGRTLQKKIALKLSIESVQITKQFPHTLNITIVERLPYAIWQAGDQQVAVDKHGVVIETQPTETNGLIRVHDLNDTPVQIDSPVIAESVMNDIVRLNNIVKSTTLSVEEYQIPIPTCPIEPEAINANTNGDLANTNVANTNTSQPLIVRTTNLNTSGNVNAPIVNEPAPVTCDITQLRQNSPEIHLKLDNGPTIYFDRHQDLQQAVSTVQRVLQDPQNLSAQYIDVRFGDRVYVQ